MAEGPAWDPERPLAEWREILMDSGWGAPTWPTEWRGRGLDRESAAVVAEEFSRAGAVGPAIGVGMGLAAPTILDHGSDELKRSFLRPAATGEHKWCQLFSEPGSGSDLAGLSTHAEQVGDEWIVNGQKVWNTGARTAHFGLLMARTDWDVPKHRGITYFVLPMQQDGVEVRPIVQMNGYQSFNEVFISDARVPADNVVGQINDGWRVGLTTLAYERVGIGTIFSPPSIATASGRTAKEAAEEAAAYLRTYVWYPSRMGRPDLLLPHANVLASAGEPCCHRDDGSTARSSAVVSGESLDRQGEVIQDEGGSEGQGWQDPSSAEVGLARFHRCLSRDGLDQAGSERCRRSVA